MTIRVALNHLTRYRYDRLATIHPQVVRLRPAPHCRTPVHSYSLKVQPANHFVNWQQDPHGNFLARFVFPEKARSLEIQVDLVVDMTVINPFDFFIEESATSFPFSYEPWLATELKPYLDTSASTPVLTKYVSQVRERVLTSPEMGTTDFLVGVNQAIQQDISYSIRLEPGVQTAEESLTLRSGSCRDSAWLLVQVLRTLGLAARFVSGYLDSVDCGYRISRWTRWPHCRLHRSARLDGSLSARCRLDWARPHLGLAHQRRAHSAGGHSRPCFSRSDYRCH